MKKILKNRGMMIAAAGALITLLLTGVLLITKFFRNKRAVSLDD